MIAGDNPDLPELIDPTSLKVHAPTAVIFVCGGDTDVTKLPQSLRDAFMRIAQWGSFAKLDIRLAEQMEFAFPRGEYAELLKFESDIAQISELILLFSESPGSLAELGAFVMDDEIAPRMLVVVDQENYNQASFIKLGPLYTLMRNYGEDTVCVIKLDDHNIERLSNATPITLTSFSRFIEKPFFARLSKPASPRTFDPARAGHLIKLITGMIQHYAALTLEEIDVLLFCLNIIIPAERLKQLLSCAGMFNWIKSERIGLTTYYSAVAPKAALHFEFADRAKRLDRARWRTDILSHWRTSDPDRFSCIKSALAAAP